MPREVGAHRVHHHLKRMTAAHAEALRAAIAAAERAIEERGEPPDLAALDAGLHAIDDDLAAWQGVPPSTVDGRPAGG